MDKRILFLDIYEQNKKFSDRKGRICGQDSVINASISLGLPIPQELIYKQFHTNIKVDNWLVDTIQAPCIANTLKCENFRFEILKYGKFYYLL